MNSQPQFPLEGIQHVDVEDESPGKRLGLDEALGLALRQFEVFRQEEGGWFIRDRQSGVCAVGDRIGHVIASHIDAKHQRTLKGAVKKDLLDHLESMAMTSAECGELHLRCGSHGGRVFHDLGERDNTRAVAIGPAGWEVVERSPIAMHRNERTGTLPVPHAGGSIDEWQALLGWDGRDERWFRRLVVWVVAAIIRRGDVPVLYLVGPAGTGKSRVAIMAMRLVDPRPKEGAGLIAWPEDAESLALVASASWVTVFDNVEFIGGRMSAALCQLVTGGEIARRRLYSNADVLTVAFRRACVVTTIGLDKVPRDDLITRMLDIATPFPKLRISETRLMAEFEALRPRLLGAIYDLASRVLAVLPSIRLQDPPRCADFAHVVAAVDSVLGWDVCADYGGPSVLMQELVEADPLALAIMEHIVPVGGYPSFTGSATELYNRLEPHRREHDRSWPANSASLGVKIRRLIGPLRQQGIEVDAKRVGKGSSISITRVSEPDQQGSTAASAE